LERGGRALAGVLRRRLCTALGAPARRIAVDTAASCLQPSASRLRGAGANPNPNPVPPRQVMRLRDESASMMETLVRAKVEAAEVQGARAAPARACAPAVIRLCPPAAWPHLSVQIHSYDVLFLLSSDGSTSPLKPKLCWAACQLQQAVQQRRILRSGDGADAEMQRPLLVARTPAPLGGPRAAASDARVWRAAQATT